MRIRKGHQMVEGVKPLPVLSERPAPPPEEPSLYDTTLTELVSEIERLREQLRDLHDAYDECAESANEAERAVGRVRDLCEPRAVVREINTWQVLAALDGE